MDPWLCGLVARDCKQSDNGIDRSASTPLSFALCRPLRRHGVTLDFSRPGKPTDNAFIESLNGKFRAECLNANWFLSLDEARRKCEAWRRDYNEERFHSAIGNKTPIALVERSAAVGPP